MVNMTKHTNTHATRADGPRKTLAVGLVGGIASGKTAVAGLFAELGARVIDADRIAHEVLELPAVCAQLRAQWGDAPFDAEGRPDRARIADLVFGDPDNLRLLNGWVHPPTRERMRAALESARAAGDAPLIVIDAPLLLEAGLEEWCDLILFVAADAACRARRARADRAWETNELARREACQHTAARKRTAADMVLDNNGSLEDTRAEVARLFRELTGQSPTNP